MRNTLGICFLPHTPTHILVFLLFDQQEIALLCLCHARCVVLQCVWEAAASLVDAAPTPSLSLNLHGISLFSILADAVQIYCSIVGVSLSVFTFFVH